MKESKLEVLDPFSVQEVSQYLIGSPLKNEVLFSPLQPKRVVVNGMRHYYYVTGEGENKKISPFYPSVTTITSHGEVTGMELKKYYASKTWEETLRHLWEARSFGSFLHITQAELSAKMMEYGNDQTDLGVIELRTAFSEYRKSLDLPYSWEKKNWMRLCKALMSWRVFCFEFNVEFLLIEKTVFNQNLGYAGTLDYLVKMDMGSRHASGNKAKGTRKYQLKDPEKFERITALVDLKSGKSGMHETGVMQLELLKRAAELNFDVEINNCFHFSPTEWRSSPGFNLTDPTKSKLAAELENVDSVLQIAKNRIGKIDDLPYKKTVSGWLMNEETDFGFNLGTKTVREAIDMYEDDNRIELGLPTDQEVEAEWNLAQYLKNAITQK